MTSYLNGATMMIKGSLGLRMSNEHPHC